MTPILVLSAGRTGTVFLTRTLPDLFPQLVAMHEPAGSRTTLMLGNARNWSGAGTLLLRRRLRRQLSERWSGLQPGQIGLEVNPMLCPVAELLPELVQPLRVVHLVRHPASWVRSIRTFRASTRFRNVIDHVPFANPYPSPRPPGWWRANRVERALHRWVYCNEQILSLQPVADAYALVRYEDLFGGPSVARTQAVSQLFGVIGLDPPADEGVLFERERANPSPRSSAIEVPDKDVKRVCGSLTTALGY